jgi:hypothetical protein
MKYETEEWEYPPNGYDVGKWKTLSREEQTLIEVFHHRQPDGAFNLAYTEAGRIPVDHYPFDWTVMIREERKEAVARLTTSEGIEAVKQLVEKLTVSHSYDAPKEEEE